MASKRAAIAVAQIGPVAVLAVVVIVSSIAVPRFFGFVNLTNVLHQAAIYVVMAIGMTFVITGGGIDLSIGSQVALTSVVMAAFIQRGGWPVGAAMVAALVFGAALGGVNGFIIGRFRIPDFIVTIATMEIYRGLALVHSAGKIWFNFPDSFRFLGAAKVFGIPLAAIIAFAIMGIGYFVYRRTYFGRYTIAIGGNRDAAVLCGIPVMRYKALQYVVMGFLNGLAAVLVTSRLNSSQATMAQGYEIHVIAAVIIGGTSLFGGSGSVTGALVGALILAIIANTMVLLGVDFFWRLVATGVIILLAVALNMWRERILREHV